MSDPDLSAEEQQVRRLLADARHDQPLPDDVADRLDAVLADLDTQPGGTAPVVDLAARRRRRTARNVLVAAAVVVVAGFAISRVDLGASGEADAGSSASESGPETAAGDTAGDAGGARPWLLKRAPVVLHRADFDERVRLLVGRRHDLADLEQGAAVPTPDSGTENYGAARVWCDSGAWGRGLRIAVRYDG